MTTNPVILVTGASSGIGAAIARLSAREGFRVVLAARRSERLQSLADEIAACGGSALPVVADISIISDVQKLVQTALDHFGQIDVLVNNAGFGRLDWLETLDPVEDVQAQTLVNQLGLIWVTQAVLPHMIERRSGHIINMASMAGLLAPPTYTIYAATKFAVRGFSEALRREVGVFGVHVSVIYPGGVETEFPQHARIQRQTGITTPPFLLLSADQVARAVLSLVRRPRRLLIIPWPMHLAVWLNALFPGMVDWAIEKRFVRLERF